MVELKTNVLGVTIMTITLFMCVWWTLTLIPESLTEFFVIVQLSSLWVFSKKKHELELVWIHLLVISLNAIGVPADGRCLFRAIAHGACLKNGEEAPNENRQTELADKLRAQVTILFEKMGFFLLSQLFFPMIFLTPLWYLV